MSFHRRKTGAIPSSSSAADSGTSSTNVRRRGFLLALGVGGAGAAALAARALPGVAGQDDSAGTDDSKGYQVTEHVQRYYRTAKI